MAHLLQRLAFILAGALVASLTASAQSGFSHKEALAAGVECLTCHIAQKDSTSLSPKRKGKVLKDFNHSFHLKFANLAPLLRSAIDNGSYLGSPNKINVSQLREHLGAAKNACQACHRGLEQSTTAPAKEHFPHMEDCLVCHNKIDAPFSCADCHSPSLKLRPANHSADFLDRHTAGLAKLNLDKTTCASCHGPKFTCLGCH